MPRVLLHLVDGLVIEIRVEDIARRLLGQIAASAVLEEYCESDLGVVVRSEADEDVVVGAGVLGGTGLCAHRDGILAGA